MEIDPTSYNLPARTRLRAINQNHIGIVKLIKSRLIQKDAIRIIETSKQIKNIEPNINISLICTSNICSKSIKLLQKENISIITEEF